MNRRHRKPAACGTYVVSIALVGVSKLAVAGLANAQPVPQDPTVPVIPVPGEAPPPPPAPVPVGAPYVPPVPGGDALQQPGQLGSITEIFSDFRSPDIMNNLFPAPAAPPTPVREMPMGPPPPLDPAFIPPP